MKPFKFATKAPCEIEKALKVRLTHTKSVLARVSDKNVVATPNERVFPLRQVGQHARPKQSGQATARAAQQQ